MEGIFINSDLWLGKEPCGIESKKAAYEAEVHSYEKAVLESFQGNYVMQLSISTRSKEVYELRANLERSTKSYMDLAQLQYINGVINYLMYWMPNVDILMHRLG